MEKAGRAPGAKVVPAVIIDQAVKLLAKYPLHNAGDDDSQHRRAAPAPPELAPDIILSESFSAPPAALPAALVVATVQP